MVEEKIEHRYYYVHETHRAHPSFPNKRDQYSRSIRYFLLTYRDPRGRVCLHNACRFGDKHFVTMMVMEAEHLGPGIVDEIIDRKDEDQLTPFYLLCEEGFRKKYDFDEEEEAFLEGFEKTIAVEVTIDKNNDGLEDDPNQQQKLEEYLEKKKQKDRAAADEDEVLRRLKEGLQYTTHQPMRQCIDLECTKPSRALLTKFLLIRGADPNIQSPNVLHTPLHWLAYWGDYRAIKQLLKHNQLDLVQPTGLCVNRYQFIEKYGAFNAFMSNNDQTPADIAGDLNNYQSLKAMVTYFKEEEDSGIREAFLNPRIRSQFEAARFSNRFTRQHVFTKDDTPPQRVQLAFLKSKNFTK